MKIEPVDAQSRPVSVERWPSEMPLFVTIVILSILLWGLIIVGTLGIGLIYVVLIGAVLFFAHAALIAHVRGSAIKLGADQFPDIYARVVEFASRSGLSAPPDAYILQADGGLNAFATKFFRGRFVVLYSDLLTACGDDLAARDMIIGHEIGHLRANHLNWNLLTLPGRVIPFLGSAYSRACEFTCDRWGAVLSGDREGARRGLLVLAAGAGHYQKVNEEAFIRQQDDLNTGWMTLARWLGTYPPLSARVQAIGPAFGSTYPARRGKLRAWAILLALLAVPVGLALAIPLLVSGPLNNLQQAIESEVLRGLPAVEDPLGGDFGQTSSSESGAAPAFGSVAEMPAPTPVPALDDPAFRPEADACFAGDLGACDELYWSTPADSPEEAYGLSCGGRLPDNYAECADLVPPAN